MGCNVCAQWLMQYIMRRAGYRRNSSPVSASRGFFSCFMLELSPSNVDKEVATVCLLTEVAALFKKGFSPRRGHTLPR